MFGYLKRLFSGTPEFGSQFNSQFAVTFDDESVVCRRPDGRVESLRWDDLATVMMKTDDTGPLRPNVTWVLIGRDANAGCFIPQGATGEDELFGRLQQLPGFNDMAFVAAMNCVENKQFICWESD